MKYKLDCSRLPFQLDPRACMLIGVAVARFPADYIVTYTMQIDVGDTCSLPLFAHSILGESRLNSIGLGQQVEDCQYHPVLVSDESMFQGDDGCTFDILENSLPEVGSISDVFKVIEKCLLAVV